MNQIDELRNMWCEWDPIGVLGGQLDDEYDYYLEPTLELLTSDVDTQALQSYLLNVLTEKMGLNMTTARKERALAFAERLVSWYESRS